MADTPQQQRPQQKREQPLAAESASYDAPQQETAVPTDAELDDNAANTTADTAVPQPTPLAARRSVQITILQEPPEPTTLHVDGIVLPCDPGGQPLISSRLLENTLGSENMNFVYSGMKEPLSARWQPFGRPDNPVRLEPPLAGQLDANHPLLLPADPPPPTAVSHLFAATFQPAEPDRPPRPAATATRAILRLAAQHNVRRLALPLPDDAGDDGTAVIRAIFRTIYNVLPTLPPNPLQAIVLLTHHQDVVAALRDLVKERPSLIPSNDLPTGRDLLNIETEAYALADMLMLRDVDPPLCVGVLGGWGSGKTFFMHLMRQRMNTLRSSRLTPEEAWPADDSPESRQKLSEFVGHIYQIEFNAWTYAKSDLWASLMQTIFSELNRQMTLEKRLEALQDTRFDPLSGGPIWQALNKMPADAQQALLTAELGQETLQALEEADIVNATADSLWSALEQVQRQERQELRKTEAELNKLTTRLSQRMAEIEQQVDVSIAQDAKAAVWTPLLARLARLWDVGRAQMEQMVDEARQEVETAVSPQNADAERTDVVLDLFDQNSADAVRWLWRHRNDRLLMAAFVLFLLLALAAPYLVATIETVGTAVRQLVLFSALPPLLPTIAIGVHLLRKVHAWRQQFDELRREFQTSIDKRVAELEQSREARINQILDRQEEALQQELAQAAKPDEPDVKTVKDLAAEDNVAAMRRRKAQLESRVERQRERIGLTANYVSVADFVTSRLQADTYQPHLGLMQQVQADLDELTDGLTVHPQDVHAEAKRKLFKRGPARIVLFIDDLDRCPPDRVVAVFEAAQLLLKTRLFVVVLALDVRYVSRALEKVYRDILSRRGDPSGLDYIEKIIQIPYRVRPIDEDALPGYLDIQMDRTGAETAATADGAQSSVPGGPPLPVTTPAQRRQEGNGETAVSEIISFGDVESALIHACCRQIELTPRSVKRLINVFKLLKLIWNRSYQGEQPAAVSGGVALLLALSARYPELMRGVFAHLWRQFRENSHDSLAQLLTVYELPAADHYLQNEFDEWLDTVRRFDGLAVLPDDDAFRITDVTLHRLGKSTFNLVRSFCFVGDVGFDADDHHKHDTP